MNRAGLIVTLSIAVLVGLIFGVDPDLDVRISRLFFDVTPDSQNFGLSIDPIVLMVHRIGWLCAVGLAVSVGIGLIVKLVLPRARLWMSTRAMTFMLVTALLGPGVPVNVMLKDHWA